MTSVIEVEKPTDDEIRAMPTSNIEDFITWRRFSAHPERGWLDAIDFETEAYVDALLALEPEPDPMEALLSR